MSNPVFMNIIFEGDKRETRSLYGKMKRLQERNEPLVKNSFHDANRWLGNLVTRLGDDYNDVYCRGTWNSLTMKNCIVCFATETAWSPPFALIKLIQQHYPSLQYYFVVEGDDWDTYLTNDAEGRFFKSRYIIDCEPDIEYFNTIEEAAMHLTMFLGNHVSPTWEALCAAANKWNDEHEDTEWYVNVKKIEVISNDEMDDYY